jgi:hypothetical protein
VVTGAAPVETDAGPAEPVVTGAAPVETDAGADGIAADASLDEFGTGDLPLDVEVDDVLLDLPVEDDADDSQSADDVLAGVDDVDDIADELLGTDGVDEQEAFVGGFDVQDTNADQDVVADTSETKSKKRRKFDKRGRKKKKRKTDPKGGTTKGRKQRPKRSTWSGKWVQCKKDIKCALCKETGKTFMRYCSLCKMVLCARHTDQHFLVCTR